MEYLRNIYLSRPSLSALSVPKIPFGPYGQC